MVLEVISREIEAGQVKIQQRMACQPSSCLIYQTTMTLDQAVLQKSYRISHLSIDEDSPVATRFRQLGFVPGMEVMCEAVAPILKNPFLIRIRDISVALAKSEAAMVGIEENFT